MRRNPCQPNMFTTNRPKIPNRIFINQPHRSSNRSNYNPNSLSCGRSNSTNNRTRIYIINTILPSKHHILWGVSILITATYSLHIFLSTQTGKTSSNLNTNPAHTREHLLITIHIAPLVLISIKPELILRVLVI